MLDLFVDASVQGIPLVLVVMAAVYFVGRAGVSGRTQLLASLAIGQALGTSYIVTQVRPPAGDGYELFVYVFGALFYGLALGLAASGVYEMGKGLVMRGANEAAGQVEDLFEFVTSDGPETRE